MPETAPAHAEGLRKASLPTYHAWKQRDAVSQRYGPAEQLHCRCLMHDMCACPEQTGLLVQDAAAARALMAPLAPSCVARKLSCTPRSSPPRLPAHHYATRLPCPAQGMHPGWRHRPPSSMSHQLGATATTSSTATQPAVHAELYTLSAGTHMIRKVPAPALSAPPPWFVVRWLGEPTPPGPVRKVVVAVVVVVTPGLPGLTQPLASVPWPYSSCGETCEEGAGQAQGRRRAGAQHVCMLYQELS